MIFAREVSFKWKPNGKQHNEMGGKKLECNIFLIMRNIEPLFFKGVAELFVPHFCLFVFSCQKEVLACFHSERKAAEKESSKTRG